MRRRWSILGIPLVVALAILAVAARSGASNVETDSSDSAFALQSTTSATTSSDWVDAIPQVYLSGTPTQWTPVTASNGVKWTPTVTRITRGTTHFAYFSLPDGSMWAGSEDDGTLWRVHDYYSSAGWTLASNTDVLNSIIWLIDAIIVIAKIIDVLAALAAVVALVLWIKHRLDTGHWFRSEDNQLTQGAWLGDPHGFTDAYYGDPTFRSTVTAWAPLTAVGANLGWWSIP